MANTIHSGTQGIVYLSDVGTTDDQAVLNIRSFSIEETQETIDATTMDTSGVTYRKTLPTFQSWSGSVDVYWSTEETGAIDATEAMSLAKPGKTELQINFWPAGDDQYELGYVGNAIVTGRTISTSVDGMVEMSLTVQGTGEITVDNGTANDNGT